MVVLINVDSTMAGERARGQQGMATDMLLQRHKQHDEDMRWGGGVPLRMQKNQQTTRWDRIS